MCGIIGSFSKDKIVELSALNSERGNKAFSLSVISGDIAIRRVIGKFNPAILNDVEDDAYYILHIQSPTKLINLSTDTIHPSKIVDNYLWHNGMILENDLAEKKQKLKSTSNWDTELINLGIIQHGWSFLDTIEGSFACVSYSDYNIHIFRNQIVPLHIDNELNISSAPFKGGSLIEYNKIFYLDLINRTVEEIQKFNNTHNPYLF